MGAIKTAADLAFRDYVTDGVPASGRNSPDKADIREVFDTIETALTAVDDRIEEVEGDLASMPADVDALRTRITNVEAVATAGIRWTPNTVHVRATANVAIATGLVNGTVLNGVTLATGNVVFLPYQTAPAQNGLYVVPAAGAASRAAWADAASELAYLGFAIAGGTVGAGEGWTLPMKEADITLGTTALNFAPVPSGALAEVQVARLGGPSLSARLKRLLSAPDLPAVVTHFYPCDEGRGDTLFDIVGSSHIDLNSGGGNRAWANGILKLSTGWFKTPSFTARAVFAAVRLVEGDATTLFPLASPSGKAISSTSLASVATVPNVRFLSGWGTRTPRKRTSNGTTTGNGLNSGGWELPLVTLAADETGTFVVGAASTGGGGASAAGPFELVALGYCSADPSAVEARQISTFVAALLKTRGILLRPQDCPEQRVLVIVGGESTAAGTKLLTALSTDQRNTFSENTLVNAYDAGSANTNGKRMRRASFRAANPNNNAPSLNTKFGMEFGIVTARNTGADDGRLLDILKVAQGSTFLTPSGADGSSKVYDTAVFEASISGTTMTVTAVTSGTIAPGQQIRGSGITAANISASGTGAGGVGTYTVSVGQNASSTTVTSSRTIAQSQSRNDMTGAEYGTLSLFTQLDVRNVLRAEALARNNGVGYTTVLRVKAEGLNDAYLGDQVITSTALYQGWLQSEHDAAKAVYGLSALRTVLIKPHLPNLGTGGNGSGLGAGDPDYPNNAIGQHRLNALNFIRTACDSFAAANAGEVFILDGNSYALDTPGDYIHPSAAGYEAMGQAVAALIDYDARAAPLAA